MPDSTTEPPHRRLVPRFRPHNRAAHAQLHLGRADRLQLRLRPGLRRPRHRPGHVPERPAAPGRLAFPEGYDPAARRVPVEIRIDPAAYASFYGTDAGARARAIAGYLLQTQEGPQLRFDAGRRSPSRSRRSPRSRSRATTSCRAGSAASRRRPRPPRVAAAACVFEPVRFVKMNAIAAAAIDFAQDRGRARARPDRRARALPRPAEDRRGGGHHLRPGEARPARAPPALPRDPAGPPRAGHDRAQPHRQHVRPGQRGHAVRHQGDGGAPEAQPDATTPRPTRW